MELSSRRSGVCTIIECIQGKAGQILGQLSVLSGPWYILKNLTTDQPKGQRGLISMAEEEGKGMVLLVTRRQTDSDETRHRIAEILD